VLFIEIFSVSLNEVVIIHVRNRYALFFFFKSFCSRVNIFTWYLQQLIMLELCLQPCLKFLSEFFFLGLCKETEKCIAVISD